MCRVLGVSPSGFYAWRHRPLAARRVADVHLRAHIAAAHGVSQGTYGVPRIHAELTAQGCASDGSGSRGSCAPSVCRASVGARAW